MELRKPLPRLLIQLVFIKLTTLANEIDGKQIFSTGHPFFDPDVEDVHDSEKHTNERMAITFPGTKWCGPGNTAGGYDDLGKYEETDKCCREHDHCENIPAGEEKYGLKNDDWFTRLHCDCDKTFYQCLHKVNGTVSNVVGRQYFLFRDRCFKEEYPITECIEYRTNILIRRCIKYHFDSTKPKKYQWFDLPLYDIESYPDLNDEDYYRIEYERQQEMLISQNMILE